MASPHVFTPSTASFETRIAELDISLFDDIQSQTDGDDRRSLLAIQAAVAYRQSPFVYLEVGSHLGGSIQPYLHDHRCNLIISIDKRPAAQPDERGDEYVYRDNSTERMIENLKRLSPEGVQKVITFDANSWEVDDSKFSGRPNICFIDGEHTNVAVERDFAFCLSAMAEPGLICFHDSNIVFQALSNIVKRLKATGKPFHAYNLPNAIFVIDLGMNIHEEDSIKELLAQNYLGYFSALESTSHYRDFYNSRFIRRLRKGGSILPLRALAQAAYKITSRLVR